MTTETAKIQKGVTCGVGIAPNHQKGVTPIKSNDINNMEWISPSEAAKIEGVARQTIIRRCNRGEYIHQIGRTKGGDGLLIKTTSLYSINNTLNNASNIPIVENLAQMLHLFAPNTAPHDNILNKQDVIGEKNEGCYTFIAPQKSVKKAVKHTDEPDKWLSRDDVLRLTEWSLRTFQRYCNSGDVVAKKDGKGWFMHVDSLPKDAREKLYAEKITDCDPQKLVRESDLSIIAAAPEYNRRLAYKYLALFQAMSGIKGKKAVQTFLNAWNAQKPDQHLSYGRYRTMLREYQKSGIIALLGNYGKSAGRTTVDDECFDYFKKHYMMLNAPTAQMAWVKTKGYAKTVLGLDVDDFPHASAFIRRLENEVGKPVIYLARHGQQAYNRRFGDYVDRTMNMRAGQVWVSDHMQMDALCFLDNIPVRARVELAHVVAKLKKNNKPVRPWLTVWRDMRTGKWLGWHLHVEAPNTDHIMQALYNAITKYGIPEVIYIDNGKDYRAKHLTGGRFTHKLRVDETLVTALTAAIGIQVMFARPYNPQTKPVERDFKNWHGWVDRGLPGYTGSNPTQKPENLAQQIKRAEILDFSDLTRLVDFYILNIVNKYQSKGKTLQGRSPDEAWAQEFSGLSSIDPNELKMYCMRLSATREISKNGWKDPDIGWFYYGEWMQGYKGQRVYVRRDPERYQIAWFFLESTHEYIGKGVLQPPTPGLALDDIQREHVADANRRKSRAMKMAKELAQVGSPNDVFEQAMHHAAGLAHGQTESTTKEAATGQVRVTPAAAALAKEEHLRSTGTWDDIPVRNKDEEENTGGKVLPLFWSERKEK